MRLRILYGTILLIAALAIYSLLVMKLATEILPDQWAIEILFYAVAGTLWIWPAARLTYWMQDLPDPGPKS